MALGVAQGQSKLDGYNRPDQHGFPGTHCQSEDVTRIVQHCRLVQCLNFLFRDKIGIAFDLLDNGLYGRPFQRIPRHRNAESLKKSSLIVPVVVLVDVYNVRGVQFETDIPVNLNGEKLRIAQELECRGAFLCFPLEREDFAYKWVFITSISALTPFESGLL